MDPKTRSSVDGAVTVSSSLTAVDDFLEIVLANDDLMAAEFDEIIGHAWGDDAVPTPPPTRRDTQGHGPRATSAEPGAAPGPGPVHPPGPRVRSPPA